MSYPTNDVPQSEITRLAGEEWADKEAAAQLLEDTKTATLAQWCAELGDIPVNRAEQSVKSSPRWRTLIESIVEARKQANVARVRYDYQRARFSEIQSMEATARAESRLV